MSIRQYLSAKRTRQDEMKDRLAAIIIENFRSGYALTLTIPANQEKRVDMTHQVNLYIMRIKRMAAEWGRDVHRLRYIYTTFSDGGAACHQNADQRGSAERRAALGMDERHGAMRENHRRAG